MKKLLVSIILVLALILSLSSCSFEDLVGGIFDNFTENEDGYAYTSFTGAEAKDLKKFLGEVIPFAPCDEYYIEGYYGKDDFENGINYYTVGNTAEDFNAYIELFVNYTNEGSYRDGDGITWTVFKKGNLVVEVAYYSYGGSSFIDVYAKLDADNTNPGGGNNNQGGNNDQGGDNTSNYTYTKFTSAEEEMFTELIGTVIPFLANDEYYVEAYTYEDEIGINFYTFDNTAADFDAYRALFTGYTLIGTYQDSYGDTWYSYQKGSFYVDMARYLTEDGYYCVDIFAFVLSSNSGSDDSGNGNNNGNTSSYIYTDFTSTEKAMFNEFCGFVIPFIANNEYYVEEYTYEDEIGINFYTFGNTSTDFASYKALFSKYTYVETYQDSYGDDCFTYKNGDFYIEISYYDAGEDYGYCVDVYVYTTSQNSGSGNTGSGDINDSGNDNTGDIIPDDGDGVYDVDFTDATNVKDVTDQGYYLDGCPTTGSPAVLVIPVDFSDATASSKGYDLETLKNAFEKNGACDYYSVYDYYFISSYGQLTLDITVLDFWFRPQYSSTYYANATMDYYGDDILIGDQLIMDEALAYLATIMDLSKFDSDGNNIIDAVVIINTLDIGDDDFHWAYRYWNLYTDDYGYYYEYDGVSANDYLWASYQFLYEDANGDFNDTSAVNTYTYIHEFGHVLGADDYYDTAGVNDPMGGCDVMDAMTGDHNAFTKFNYGWITTSKLVTTDTSVTLTLEDFSKNGDTIIIANNWSDSLGAYQEYYIVVYYRQTGLNGTVNGNDFGYFSRDGIVVYHVNATLYSEEYDGEIYYDIYNNNTDYSDDYGTRNNLIEFVLSGNDTYTYVVGDTLPSVTDDNGTRLQYTFTVDALEGDYATITFSKV